MSIADGSNGCGSEPLNGEHDTERAAGGATVQQAMVRGGLLKQDHAHEEVLPALRLSEPIRIILKLPAYP